MRNYLMVNGVAITEEYIQERMAFHGLPDYMAGAVFRYLVHSIEGGSFLNAALSNDLMETVGQADENNMRLIKEWVQFMYCELPIGSWGSRESVSNWLKQRRVE